MAANSAASNLSRSSTVSLHLAASILNHLFALSHGRTTKQQGKGERIDANIFSIIPRRIGTKKFLWCPPPPSLSSAPISSAFSYSVRLEIDSHGCLAANVFPLSFPSFLSSRRRNHRSQGTFDIQITPT